MYVSIETHETIERLGGAGFGLRLVVQNAEEEISALDESIEDQDLLVHVFDLPALKAIIERLSATVTDLAETTNKLDRMIEEARAKIADAGS